jgi:hypothetical protein
VGRREKAMPNCHSKKGKWKGRKNSSESEKGRRKFLRCYLAEIV